MTGNEYRYIFLYEDLKKEGSYGEEKISNQHTRRITMNKLPAVFWIILAITMLGVFIAGDQVGIHHGRELQKIEDCK